MPLTRWMGWVRSAIAVRLLFSNAARRCWTIRIRRCSVSNLNFVTTFHTILSCSRWPGN